jgi:hypothetical protein
MKIVQSFQQLTAMRRTQNKRKRTPMEDARRQVPRRIRDHQVPRQCHLLLLDATRKSDSDAFAEAFADAVG